MVGEDESLGVHDEARALAAARTVAVAIVGRAGAALGGALRDRDVDDGGVDALDDVGEVRRAARHGGRRGGDGVHHSAPGGQDAQQPRHTGHQ